MYNEKLINKILESGKVEGDYLRADNEGDISIYATTSKENNFDNIPEAGRDFESIKIENESVMYTPSERAFEEYRRKNVNVAGFEIVSPSEEK